MAHLLHQSHDVACVDNLDTIDVFAKMYNIRNSTQNKQRTTTKNGTLSNVRQTCALGVYNMVSLVIEMLILCSHYTFDTVPSMAGPSTAQNFISVNSNHAILIHTWLAHLKEVCCTAQHT